MKLRNVIKAINLMEKGRCTRLVDKVKLSNLARIVRVNKRIRRRVLHKIGEMI